MHASGAGARGGMGVSCSALPAGSYHLDNTCGGFAGHSVAPVRCCGTLILLLHALSLFNSARADASGRTIPFIHYCRTLSEQRVSGAGWAHCQRCLPRTGWAALQRLANICGAAQAAGRDGGVNARASLSITPTISYIQVMGRIAGDWTRALAAWRAGKLGLAFAGGRVRNARAWRGR